MTFAEIVLSFKPENMPAAQETESENCLIKSTTTFPSRWLKNNRIKIEAREQICKGLKNGRNYSRISVCLSCGLYNFACSVEAELSKLATSKLIEKNHNILSKWSPDYWQTMGALSGCLLSGMSLCYMGRKTSLQWIALPLLTLAFISTYISVNAPMSISSPWNEHAATVQIFLQSMSSSLSMIIPTVYMLETVCWHPGSYKSRATALVLILTNIPAAIANLLTNLGVIVVSENFAIPVPATLIIITLISVLISPESPRWLLQVKHSVSESMAAMKLLWFNNPAKYKIDKEVEVMRREMQSHVTICTPVSYIRPLLVLSCFLLLSQLAGYGVFKFYAVWAYKLADLTWLNSDVVSAQIRLIGVCLASLITVLYAGPKSASVILLVTTPIVMTCLLVIGLFTYSLEHGNVQMNQYAMLPIVMLVLYETAFWFGIGTFAIPVCALVVPPKSRPIVLTIAVVVYQITSYFSDLFLPLMISVLHPYGVFWLHAFLTGVTLVYISFVIIPELKWMATFIKNEEMTETVI